MRILSLSTCPLDPMLGSGKTRLRWSEGLRALGHDVDIFEPKHYETLLGAKRGLRFRQAWGASGFVKDKLKTKAYDLVEFFGGEFGFITWQLSSRRNRPAIVAHTDGLELLAAERERAYSSHSNERRSRGLWQQIHARLSRAAFVYADAFVTGCQLDRDYVLDNQICRPGRAAVVAPGVDEEYLNRPFAAAKEKRIAFTGSWIPRKGIDKLVAVVKNVLSKDESVGFDVYGSGGNRAAVLAALPPRLGDRIVVHGRLSNEELAEGLSRARVFLFPSQYEGFGMALSEAMGCSCAAVTTRTGFGAELRDGEEALLCDFDDTDAMERAVVTLLNDEAVFVRIARAGWERVQDLSWPSNIRRLEETYIRWVSEHQLGR